MGIVDSESGMMRRAMPNGTRSHDFEALNGDVSAAREQAPGVECGDVKSSLDP